MGYTCEYCGSSNVRKTTDEELYFGGSSLYCEDCDSGFESRDFHDHRKYTGLASPTSLERMPWESEDDYTDRTGKDINDEY